MYKGIWKKAVVAAVIVFAGSIFVKRVQDWTKGLNSEFVVYGQGTAGGGTGGSGTFTATVTKAVPQIVGGGGYRTFIEIINPGTSLVNVTATFYKPDPTALTSAAILSTLPFKKDDLKGNVTTLTGSMPPTPIPAGGMLLLDFPNAGPTTVTNWGLIGADGPFIATAAFEVREDVTGILKSFVGVAASPVDMKQFVIPRVRHTVTNLDVGFAVANTGSTSATITIRVKNTNNQVLAVKDVTLGPKQQTAVFPFLFFVPMPTDPIGPSFSYLEFTSTSGQFAATALAVEGPNLAGFPVERIQ